MPSLHSTARRKSPALMLAVALAFAVFVWGLQYKVSLYYSAAAQHAIPAAKLLSQRERPLASAPLERLTLEGLPLAAFTSKLLHSTVAELPANAHLEALERSGERLRTQPSFNASDSRHFSRIAPRAPPFTA
ncbi:hypothetical protein [Granulicella sp. S156]|uniref:hypothetical protein n=1 Tax=Granulicella sp. S156 TaxID=1747224 RepID=UPI00131BF966|nr:hypothetical protein [Granulicella sp. S156]